MKGPFRPTRPRTFYPAAQREFGSSERGWPLQGTGRFATSRAKMAEFARSRVTASGQRRLKQQLQAQNSRKENSFG